MSKVVITGASGNIGQALADDFTKRGFEVIGLNSSSVDFSQSGNATEYFSQLLNSKNDIRFIINNAAIQDVALLSEGNARHIEQMLQVNFGAIAELYQVVARLQASAELPLQSILNISSIESVQARPGHSIYGASKAALDSLTRSAAAEIAPIRSNSLRLGLIRRDGIESAWPKGVESWKVATPLGRMGEVEDICQAATYLLEASWLTGQILTLDGGNSAQPNW